MTLTQLQYFCKACELNNITKASEQLFVSQPTITAAIRGLEKEFSLPLLERKYKGFQLTEEGRQFYEEARQFLAEADHFSQRMRWLAEQKSVLALGLSRSSGMTIYVEYFPYYMQSHANVQTNITTGGGMELMQKVLLKQIDAAILPYPSQDVPKNLRAYPLKEVEFTLIVSENHPLAGKEKVTAEDILHEKIVSTRNDILRTEKLKELFAPYGVEPDVVCRYDQVYTAFQMIRKENLCGIFLKEMAEQHKGLVSVPLEGMRYIDATLMVLEEMMDQKKVVREFVKDIVKFYKTDSSHKKI